MNDTSAFCNGGHDPSVGVYRVGAYDVCKVCHRENIEASRNRLRSLRSHREEMLEDELPRFMRKVSKEQGGCWNWTGSINGSGGGYPLFTIAGRQRLAHRVSLRFFKGDFDDDRVVDHLCRNSRCVNPEHLEAVSHDENMARGKVSGAAAIRRRIEAGATRVRKVGPALVHR